MTLPYTFRALPDRGPFRIVMGSNVGTSHETERMEALVRDLRPDLVVFGGNSVYENNNPECFCAWD